MWWTLWMCATCVLLTGCEVSMNQTNSDGEIKEPVIHPPKLSYGDVVIVGNKGQTAGIIVGIKKLEGTGWTAEDWEYIIMFQNDMRISYRENELQLYRKMDWAGPQFDGILADEYPVNSDDAEITNEEAIP